MSTYDADDVIHQLYWKKCAGPNWDEADTEEKLDAFRFFCSNFVHIRHPKRGKILFDLRDAQISTARDWLEHPDTLALKARQVGFSTLISVFALWCTYFHNDRTIIMVSKGQREASQLLTHAKYAYRMFPEWLRLWGPPIDSDTRELMSFCNDSAIESAPSAADPARGRTAFLVVVDEIGFLPNSEEAWASIEPVAEIGGRLIMLGTANGEGNLMHREWVKSKGKYGTGDGRFFGIFHSWRAAGHNDDWYAVKSEQLESWQLHQEYPSNPDEAFLKSGNPMFNLEALAAQATSDPLFRGYLATVEGKLEFINDGGNLRVWSKPEPHTKYVIGVDVAEGLSWGDYSVADVINAETGEVVAVWHGHIDPDVLGEKMLPLLGAWYNTCLIGVESNNHGLTTLKALQRTKYLYIYRQHRMASKGNEKTTALGWRTTSVTKPVAIDELNKAIRDQAIAIPDSETHAELRQFVREADGKMHGSPHDDRVMALAIANQMLASVFLPEYTHTAKPGVGTFGHWMATMYDDDLGGADDPFQKFGYRNNAA